MVGGRRHCGRPSPASLLKQSHIWVSFEPQQGRRLPNLFGQPGAVLQPLIAQPHPPAPRSLNIYQMPSQAALLRARQPQIAQPVLLREAPAPSASPWSSATQWEPPVRPRGLRRPVGRTCYLRAARGRQGQAQGRAGRGGSRRGGKRRRWGPPAPRSAAPHRPRGLRSAAGCALPWAAFCRLASSPRAALCRGLPHTPDGPADAGSVPAADPPAPSLLPPSRPRHEQRYRHLRQQPAPQLPGGRSRPAGRRRPGGGGVRAGHRYGPAGGCGGRGLPPPSSSGAPQRSARRAAGAGSPVTGGGVKRGGQCWVLPAGTLPTRRSGWGWWGPSTAAPRVTGQAAGPSGPRRGLPGQGNAGGSAARGQP